VDEEGDVDAALKGTVPEGDIVLYQRAVDPATGGVRKIPYLMKEKTLMTGEVLKDARVSIDTQFNEPMSPWNLTRLGLNSSSRSRVKM